MGGTGKKSEPPHEDKSGKSKKSPPAVQEDEDFEDGDFATPKRDWSDDDDRPL